MVRFHALGSVTITESDRELAVGGPRQRRLLAMLLVHRNTVVSTDRLADVVFDGEPTPAASTTLRSYVARVRRVIDGAEGIGVVTQAPGYLLQLPDDAFDVARFERMVGEARGLVARGDAIGGASVLRQALDQWRGQAYAEFADEEWAQPEAQRLGELRLAAQEELFDAELTCGRAADLVPEIESLARQHPLRERSWSLLMLALYRAGRQADALRAFQEHRAAMVEELGLDPGPSLRQLEERILAHDPELLLAEPVGTPLRGYRLGERLGTGHDGTVSVAHLPGVERDIVIRVVRAEVADDPDFVRGFESTVHRVAALRHEAIVPIVDYWREPGGAYVVMRRLRGGSLADRLDRGRLADHELLELTRRVGSALVTAADAGLVHGRVCANSVLYDDDGHPFLSDFALVAGGSSPADDVRALAALLRSATDRDDVREAAAGETGSMAELVAAVIDVLASGSSGVPHGAANPYKGLRAFDEADAPDFFGRDAVVDEILRRLEGDGPASRLVLVVGGSGTGKSSAVRAGLLPRLRAGAIPGARGWYVATMLPGPAPFKELAESLEHVAVEVDPDLVAALSAPGGIDEVLRRVLPPGAQLLLVVDQLEELFTTSSEADQRAFLEGLMEAIDAPGSRLRVVCTLRADFFDRPLGVQRFGAAVSDATVTIPVMAPAELEAAIVEPARRGGRVVEGALVAELVDAVAHEPAALPSLQFTLFELAETSTGDLTLAAYRELGGVTGAITSRAEALYRSLDDGERAAVRRVFEQLVVINPDGEPTRRPAARAELVRDVDAISLGTVIDRWADARLLSLDRHQQTREPTVEVAHEALLREWPRLRRWIDEDRDVLVALGQLREAAAGWEAVDRDAGALYRGARLQVALDATASRTDTLAGRELEFLDASTAARDAEEHEVAAAAARQVRVNRRLRTQLAAIGIALVIALVGGFVALDQRGQAEQERRIATARELASSSVANLGDDPELSILLALQAIDTTRSHGEAVRPEAIEALHQAVAANRILRRVPGVGGTVDWSTDGSVFVTEGVEESGLVDIRDAETGESVRSFRGDDVDINDIAFSADGTRLAVAGDEGYLKVFDPATGDELARLGPGENAARAPSFSPDGSRVAAGWMGEVGVQVFDVASGELIATVPNTDASEVDFSPDGSRIVVPQVWDVGTVVADSETGQPLLTLDDGDHEGTPDAKFSPDGRWLATAHGDGTVQIWDAATGEPRHTFTGHTSAVAGLDWSPDSTRFATVGQDGTARVVDLLAGGVREVLTLSNRDSRNGLTGVDFSPDGERLMTGDGAITSVTIWDVTPLGGAELAALPTGLANGTGAFTGEDELLLETPDGTMAFWDVEKGELARELDVGAGPGELRAIALSPDDEVLATAVPFLPVSLWDARSGRQLGAVTLDEIRSFVEGLAEAEAFVEGISWSPDGEHLVLALHLEHTDGDTMSVTVVVDRDGTPVTSLRSPQSVELHSAVFTADGRWIVTSQVSSRQDPLESGLAIWDWREAELEREVRTRPMDLGADPLGERIAVVNQIEGSAEVWDLARDELVSTFRSSGSLFSVEFRPDGEQLAFGGADGTIGLGDPRTGEDRLVLRGHESGVGPLSFSPSGTRLAAGGFDGVVRVYALDLDELIEIAGGKLTRSLADDECRQWLHMASCRPAS